MNNLLIPIIDPSYNQAYYLQVSLLSIFAQTCQNCCVSLLMII